MTYRVDFLMVTNADAEGDPRDIVWAALHAALSVASDDPIEADAVERAVTINYGVDRGNGQKITGFTIDFEAPDEDGAGTVIEEFSKTLRDLQDEGVEHLLKLTDPVQRAQQRLLGDQLHAIEMKLREAPFPRSTNRAVGASAA